MSLIGVPGHTELDNFAAELRELLVLPAHPLRQLLDAAAQLGGAAPAGRLGQLQVAAGTAQSWASLHELRAGRAALKR